MSDGRALEVQIRVYLFVCDRSLAYNGLNEDATQAIKDAAGSRVELSF